MQIPELTIEAIVAWLRTQPQNREYTWQDPAFCLVGQYLADNGSSWGFHHYSDIPHYNEIAETKPHTFGAALERAEALKLLPPPSDHPMLVAEPLALTEVQPGRATLALPAK